MNVFAQWRTWASALDDAAFSRLWLALGAVTALRLRGGVLPDGIGDVWTSALHAQELNWAWPQFKDLAAIRLQGIAPEDWIKRWNAEIGARLDKVPVRIVDWTAEEPPEPWLARLAQAAPVASLRLAEGGNRMLGWPLRLAAMAEADQAVLQQACDRWPSKQLARRVGSAAECIACDLLLHTGDLDTLLAQLKSGVVAANMVLVCLQRPLAGDDFQRLEETIKAAEAGGIVAMVSSGGIDLPSRINRFVEELSHARRVDVAACLAFGGSVEPVLVGLGDDLARFSIHRVAERLLARAENLQRATGLPLAARAELDHVMPRVPAAPAYRAAESSGLESTGAESAEPAGGLESLGGEESAGEAGGSASAPAYAMPEERIPDYEHLEAPYDHESGGATSLVEAADALDRAEAVVSTSRHLQQRSFVVRAGREVKATHGFEVGLVARVRVHIGPPDRESNALPEPFPENALPQELASWDLDVWLSEPEHVPVPLHGRIHLRRTGPSSTCDLEFTPRAAGSFNGRISVLHRGRVIQTAALRASVNPADTQPADGMAPTLESIIQLRRDLAEAERRPFDLAFVLNHSGESRPTAQSIGSDIAWVLDLSAVDELVDELNSTLSKLTRTARDFAGGLASQKGKDLLHKLATIGSNLYYFLAEPLGQNSKEEVREKLLHGSLIQIVSTRRNAVVVPFEFIYAYAVPDPDAELCGNWRKALEEGQCPGDCKRGADTFCPMGFWGLSKVIERHALQPELAREGEIGVRMEESPKRTTLKISGNALYACSKRVADTQLEPLRQRLTAARMTASQAKDWKDWAALVEKLRPTLLIALAHADGVSSSATVELGGQAIYPVAINETFIHGQDDEGVLPLVALLGCEMAGTGAGYTNPVGVFSTRGAGAVIGTIATVLAEHSAEVAARLIQGLTFADPTKTQRLADVMLELKRNALLDGELMPLCLIGFGDADRKLSN